MAKAVVHKIWIERWMPQREWNLCIQFSEDPFEMNAYPIHHTDAEWWIKRDYDNRGDIWEPRSQGDGDALHSKK